MKKILLIITLLSTYIVNANYQSSGYESSSQRCKKCGKYHDTQYHHHNGRENYGPVRTTLSGTGKIVDSAVHLRPVDTAERAVELPANVFESIF